MDCRRLEIREAMHAIERNRIAWIVAEHDMGGDDFLAVLRQAQGAESQEVFRLDLSSFEGLLDDLHSLQTIVMGGNINRLCEQLLSAGKAYLLLDDVRIGVAGENGRKIAGGIQELAQTALDYCPELKVIVRSHLPFEVVGIRPIILRALDEPECKHYVELHPRGKNARKEDIDSGAIHSHTAGWPGRIDKLLKALSINNFESIAHGSSDESIDERATLPEALIEVIEQMRHGDEHEQKTYSLLAALTFFKFGESINTIKYFGGRQRFRPGMADDLVGAGLAEPAETFELAINHGEQDKLVLIKPAVQQYIHKLLGEECLIKRYEDAAAIYFGKDWKIGTCKLHSVLRFSSHRIHSIAEQNAALILTRLISDSLDSEEHEFKQKNILDRVRILHYYLLRLAANDKYLHIVRLCRALLPKLADLDNHNLVKDIRFQYARGLRMLGEHHESIEQCQTLLKQVNSAEIVARLYINMAYSYECLEEIEQTKKMARTVVAMKIKGEPEYHAKSILIGLTDDNRKHQQLDKLAVKARREGCNVSSNNMKMDVIAELNDPLQQMSEYRKLAERARLDGDSYNMIRAVIYWMEIAVEQEATITSKDVDSLVAAYTYACSQRQRRMFHQSHAVLWVLLEKARQIEKLLQLFRHSSTLQRLTGKAKVELDYLKRLVGYIREIGLEQVAPNCDPSTLRYFAARANSHNLLNPKQLQLIRQC